MSEWLLVLGKWENQNENETKIAMAEETMKEEPMKLPEMKMPRMGTPRTQMMAQEE